MKKSLLIACCIFFTTASSLAQIIYNIDLKVEIGFPDPDIPWSANIPSGPFGGPIITGNTVTESEAANVLTTVLDSYGNIVWEQQWNSTDSGNDYGSSLALYDDTLIVGGATFNLSQNAYDYVILAYDVTDGTLLWTTLYNARVTAMTLLRVLPLIPLAVYMLRVHPLGLVLCQII